MGFATGSFKYDWCQISDLKVRVYGDTATARSRSDSRAQPIATGSAGEVTGRPDEAVR